MVQACPATCLAIATEEIARIFDRGITRCNDFYNLLIQTLQLSWKLEVGSRLAVRA